MEEYLDKIDVNTVSMQTLAFIGDAIYNVYIRTYLASKSTAKAGILHKDSIKYVSAVGQSATIEYLMDFLTEEEISIYKRGRNTNIPTVSKNVDVIEYKKATGFEALIGYLYVIKDKDRLNQIMRKSIERFN